MDSYNKASMHAAIMRDQELARIRQRQLGSRRIGKSGRHTMQVDLAAFMNAVNTEGREVIHDKEYWRDMRRRHPWTDIRPDQSVPRGMRNRWGRVKERKVYGQAEGRP